MKYLLNSAEMKQCDANTMERYGMLSAVLMERAACAVVEEIRRRFPDPAAKILIACGSGNNGGDGFAMGRLLYLQGYTVTIAFVGKEDHLTVEAARQLSIARNYGVEICIDIPDHSYDVVCDAIFGIGLCRNIEGNYKTIIEKLNRLDAFKVAVDISSGLSADTGKVMGICFEADLTVTMGFGKIGQYLYPGCLMTGELIVADIGIDEHSLFEICPQVLMLEEKDLSLLPGRDPASNKGTYGKILIIAGSKNMAGAAIFAAKAAYRIGAGLVKVVTPKENREIIQISVPEAVLSVYDDETDMESYMATELAWATAVVLGPGLSTSEKAEQIVRNVLSGIRVPCVLDADGLNILAGHLDWLELAQAPLILTPHMGEMSRLTGKSISEIKADPFCIAVDFARKHRVILCLKDARTIVALPSGICYLNTTGNHGMSTGGAGDVLSGVIGGLLGQRTEPETAAALGVWIHGKAGDLAALKREKRSVMAGDLVEALSDIFIES